MPLIQAFLAGRKMPGIPPETFEERTTVEAVAGRAEKAGAIAKFGRTDTWALPEMPTVRTLPEGWADVTDVRPRFYEREAGFAKLANDFAKDVIAQEVTKRIAKLITNPANPTPWQELVELGLARGNEKFSVVAARRRFYEARNRYDVDHVTPLAQHWNARGNDMDQPTRVDATRGAPGERGLQLLEKSINRSKGSKGVKYDPFVKPNFTSPKGDQFRPDGNEFYRNYKLRR